METIRYWRATIPQDLYRVVDKATVLGPTSDDRKSVEHSVVEAGPPEYRFILTVPMRLVLGESSLHKEEIGFDRHVSSKKAVNPGYSLAIPTTITAVTRLYSGGVKAQGWYQCCHAHTQSCYDDRTVALTGACLLVS